MTDCDSRDSNLKAPFNWNFFCNLQLQLATWTCADLFIWTTSWLQQPLSGRIALHRLSMKLERLREVRKRITSRNSMKKYTICPPFAQSHTSLFQALSNLIIAQCLPSFLVKYTFWWILLCMFVAVDINFSALFHSFKQNLSSENNSTISKIFIKIYVARSKSLFFFSRYGSINFQDHDQWHNNTTKNHGFKAHNRHTPHRRQCFKSSNDKS